MRTIGCFLFLCVFATSGHREYMEALYAAVKSARASGLSLQEAQETIQLPEFSDMGRYDEWLGENIEGMYGLISDEMPE